MARRPSLRLRAGAFDLAIAAFAAVATGFAGFALPEWRLFQLFSAVGLPEILAAAQPPLGLKARLGTALLFAAAAFAAVYLLMRLLDRLPRTEKHAFEGEGEAQLPIRLRRADAHPDNPARRPLVAGRELGEPFEELLLEQKVDAPPPGRRRRSFPAAEVERPVASEAPTPSFEHSPPPRNWTVEEQSLDASPQIQLQPSVFAADPIDVQPEPDHSQPEPSPEHREIDRFATEPFVPARQRDEQVVDFMELGDEPEPLPLRVPRPGLAADSFSPPAAVQRAEPQPQRATASAPVTTRSEEESISALMARLETGLARRERQQPSAGAHSAPLTGEDSIAERLRNAMSDLQKLAARN